MKLIPFLLVNLAAFAILQFAWIPAAERRLRIDRTMATIRRAGLLSLLGLGRSVFLMATLTTALLVVLLFILNLLGGVTASEVTTAIESIHRWRGLLVSVGPVMGWITTLLLVLAFAIYARRSSRRNMVKVFREVYARKFAELRQDYELGKLKEMPPTGEMRNVAKKIGEINQALARLEHETLRDDPKTILMREELDKQVVLLQQYYVSLDMQRRIDVELDPDDAALPEARTRWEKFQTFFISRGLLASLNGTSRALFFATLILLVPSLTGIYAATTATALNDRLVQLKDLRVELSRREFEQEKARLGEPTNELSDEDKRDLQEVARNYEQTVPQFLTQPAVRSMASVRSTIVREAILNRAATQANTAAEQQASGANWQQHASGSKVQELTPLEREVVLAPEQTAGARGPVTPRGQHVYAELEDIAHRSPSFMQRVRTGLHSFQKPASSYDLSNALFNRIAGNLTGEASPELGNAIQGLTTNRRYAAFNGFTEMRSREFLTDLMRGSSLDEALGRAPAAESRYAFLGKLEKLEFHSTMRTVADEIPLVSINEKLAGYPPTVDVAPETHVNMQKAADAVERFRNSVRDPLVGNSGSLADSLADFHDWFPPQVGAELETPRGKLVSIWEGRKPGPAGAPVVERVPNIPKPPPGEGIPSVPRTGTSWWSFLRARAFDALRGFSRVGGVLIGQTPKEPPAPKLDFADLRWEINGSQVRFVLVRADGTQISSRPYRTSIAYQALNYAADGRPLAATMVSAEPLLELKILLHPTLVDTPLGQRVIELDRLVDNYTSAKPERIEAEERVHKHHFLYTFAWAVRALAYCDLNNDGGDIGADRELQQQLRELINDETFRADARKALTDLGTIADPRLSPLTVKKEFYDQTLVEILAKSPPTTTLDSLSEAIRANVTERVNSLSDSADYDGRLALHRRWLSRPPEIMIWSGVRERDFDTNPENILSGDGASANPPFNFMLQVAFVSPPAFIDEAKVGGYADSQPWEFPALRDMIQSTVLEHLARDQRARTVVDDSAEFTMAQRLFRLGLDGQLGENFPVEKLLELDQALSAGASPAFARTLRWSNRFGSDLTAAALQLKQAESDAAREAVTLTVFRNGGEPALKLLLALQARETQELTLMEEIRQQLGVAKDDEQIQKERNASLPNLD